MSTLSLLDSPLFGGSLVNGEMRSLFDNAAFINRCVETEVALATSEARLGLIPEAAAAAIASAARTIRFDLTRLGRETELVGYPILPIVEQMADACGEAGGYLHWGATTQDIMDTATVLQIRHALDLVEQQLEDTVSALRKLDIEHPDTLMAGRTHLQQALPITFGYKAAVWLSALERHRERLVQLRPRVLVVQFSGGFGNAGVPRRTRTGRTGRARSHPRPCNAQHHLARRPRRGGGGRPGPGIGLRQPCQDCV
ncbi:lyase family protein [Rhizobium sp. G21]|uniref:lyase family protein n=1 Tax=Rhizobium sp. G21 TaxID=2758439 RepID=UPI0028A5DD88|nr:lyase family protein [Rhizobium sp. G21]